MTDGVFDLKFDAIKQCVLLLDKLKFKCTTLFDFVIIYNGSRADCTLGMKSVLCE